MSKISSALVALGVVAGLSAAAVPMSSYAIDPDAVVSAPVTIRATVKSDIAVSTNGVDLVDFGDLNNQMGEQVQTIAVTVSGSVEKYDLGVMDYDNVTDMVSATTADVIPTKGGDTLEEGWGFRLESRHETPNAWLAMPAYDTAGASTNLVEGGTLDKTDGSTSNVQFGINIKGMTLGDGVYEDKVIFTAVENTTVAP